MFCEPYLNLPQQIDLVDIKKSQKISIDSKKPIKNSVISSISEQKDYNILPSFKNQFDHLNNILSPKSNTYLACRWVIFLNNVPEKYVKIRLYMDYKKSLERPKVQRKSLNGQFYGIDNKLAPIPQLTNPRGFTKSTYI